MFNWLTGPWLAGIVAILIAFAFFWPQSKNTPVNTFEQSLNENNQSDSFQDSTSGRINTFSRKDDAARLEEFKEIDKFDTKVRILLEEAQTLVDKLSYTLPEERNALLVYREVIELSPNNLAAQQGIEEISKRLYEIGHRALINNKLSAANRTLQKLINIDEVSEQTIDLTSAIANWHEKKKFTDLLIAGNAAFERRDFISPATKNALYFYEQALKQDNSSQQAKAGINKIIDIYRQRTRNAIDAQLYSSASTNLEILTEIDPNDQFINQFQAEISQLKISQQSIESENEDQPSAVEIDLIN